ncbi:20S proteasome subunit [Dichomitus squalens]|uniref:Proteasome subunit alpha type n=2 Tax=Dichomitus squalens TaxID=114155 RepID=A0A4Q9PVA5_9APHY|nr:20S proteasome subunit [Dichomitus squalens LYAD-421 SS1]EJF56596.1 20S proteasome subunit [Dichomitus squalens LYAD-421 SS1]TBU33207.1 20S proteasome subunit [Dichomitus squalens]TBU46591.1 20S proteasome subunit [Dichomitus squalens]TBU58386.1 20S proteasome subunit [Dichomitus squalens]
MTSIGTGYDLSASTYSPDGRIFQVEYANKAVENSGTAIGLRVKDGVVLAVEKLIHSKLLVPEANRRIQTIDKHIGLASAGYLADGRHVSNRARDEASSFRENYRAPATLQYVVDRVGLYVQAYTLYSSVRPFGCSTIIGGVDKHGPALFVIEPSGVSYGYRGAAVGKGRQLAKTELEKLKFSELTMKEAVTEAARIIYLVHDDAKEKDFELEMSWVGDETNGIHQAVPKDLLDEASRKAKEALETFE